MGVSRKNVLSSRQGKLQGILVIVPVIAAVDLPVVIGSSSCVQPDVRNISRASEIKEHICAMIINEPN